MLCCVQGQYEMDVHTFCERSVDVMGEESDHIHAQALTDAVQVSQQQQQRLWTNRMTAVICVLSQALCVRVACRCPSASSTCQLRRVMSLLT
jgi:hypothetical protein